MESMNDKLSIKNLLFSKAIPNYIVPVPVNGHKLYICTDCGDKFILESSLEDHLQRKSIQITYQCKHCTRTQLFYNRCNFLAHIRSHSFKTATINVTDIKVEPLPLEFFKMETLNKEDSSQKSQSEALNKKTTSKCICSECKQDITNTGVIYKDRAKHFMQYTNQTYSCPVCMFTLPTSCALKAHLRLHLKCPPYFCSECGIHLPTKSISYPYAHDCQGFNMMRATARLLCPSPKCSLFHPNGYQEHFKENHLKTVYKCPYCYVGCFSDSIMKKHLKAHKFEGKPGLLFFQCEICPAKMMVQSHVETHIKNHQNNVIFPCWACGTIFKDILGLIEHKRQRHNLSAEIFYWINSLTTKSKKIYRVVKMCEQCKRSFTYKCDFDQIANLPKECPYQCSLQSPIICHMCKQKVSQDWEEIKKHYAKHHKKYRCLDIKVVIEKMDIEEQLKKQSIRIGTRMATDVKRLLKKKNKNPKKKKSLSLPIVMHGTGASVSSPSRFKCKYCESEFKNKIILEKHILCHRDPCMAYQCMECGQSFVVKPSFSTHLLLEHGIADVEDYISKKECYNENALMKYGSNSIEPLRKNQCRICREQFNNADDLEKHFRVHGMAFLMQNNNKSNSP